MNIHLALLTFIVRIWEQEYDKTQRLEQEAELERSKKNKPKIKDKNDEITR